VKQGATYDTEGHWKALSEVHGVGHTEQSRERLEVAQEGCYFLDVWSGPLAGTQALLGCATIADAYGNGEWMLPVATRAMQLKVFRGTKLPESEMSGLEHEEG
jgi:hypothetical protein